MPIDSYGKDESALRRFEIVFFASLPFTILYSYLIMSGISYVQDKDLRLEEGELLIVGTSGVVSSSLIAYYDLKKNQCKLNLVRINF
ncbi:MAG: hypothetical protein QME40_05195 [bacterium]|nr:hypothetical protein [bacterium]